MSYTTVSGTLTGDTVWTAGTYYLSDNVSISNYNLTLNCNAGNIVIKTAGDKQIVLNGSGDLLSSNTGVNNKVIFTSKNDDAHGEVISGSSGTPTSGDQSVPYTTVTYNGCSFSLLYSETWYCKTDEKGIFCWGEQPLRSFNNNVTIKNLTVKYCGLNNYDTACFPVLIGMYNSTGIGTVLIENIKVDNTNSMENTITLTSLIRFPRSLSLTVRQCNFYPVGTLGSFVRVVYSTNGTFNSIIEDIRGVLPTGVIAGNCAFSLLYQTGQINSSTIIRRFIIDGINKSTSGINISAVSGATGTCDVSDGVIINWNCGVDRHDSGSSVVITENYNGFYNNNIDSDLAIGANSFVANPQLSNSPGSFPGGSSIDPESCHDNGYFIGNLTDYEKKGSNTFDNLSIDEEIYSATGYRYAGTDKITPGVNYSLTQFYLYGVVTFVEGAHGTIVGNKNQMMIDYGENCSKVIASPDDGYDFSSWSGDRTGSDDALTVTNVTSDLTIRANFSQQFSRQKIHENRGNNECVIDSTDGSFHPGRTRFHVRQNVSFR